MKNRITATFTQDLGNIKVSDATGEVCEDIDEKPLNDYNITMGTDLYFYAYTFGTSIYTTVTIEYVSGEKKGQKETFANLSNGDPIRFPSVAGKIPNYRNFDDFVKEIKEAGGIAQ